MFSKFFTFLLGIEQTIEHDVEQIISSFTTTVSKLEAAAVAKTKEAAEHAEQALHFEALSDVATNTANLATEVAAKIKALVS